MAMSVNNFTTNTVQNIIMGLRTVSASKDIIGDLDDVFTQRMSGNILSCLKTTLNALIYIIYVNLRYFLNVFVKLIKPLVCSYKKFFLMSFFVFVSYAVLYILRISYEFRT